MSEASASNNYFWTVGRERIFHRLILVDSNRDTMASVQKAAQELIEMEALCMNLRSRRSECIGKIKSIKTTDDTSYFLADSEVKYLRIFESPVGGV